MIIHRVTAVAREGETDRLVELMKTEARALFQISRIGTIADPEQGERNLVVFDIDFDDRAGLQAWKDNVGAPDNKAFFERWRALIDTYSAQDFFTDG